MKLSWPHTRHVYVCIAVCVYVYTCAACVSPPKPALMVLLNGDFFNIRHLEKKRVSWVSALTEDKPWPPVLDAWTLSHWTTREVPNLPNV